MSLRIARFGRSIGEGAGVVFAFYYVHPPAQIRQTVPGKSESSIRKSDLGCYSRAVPAQTSRDRILEALQDLPADATVDDAIERLVFLAKIDAGLAELDAGQGVPHEEVKRRLGL